MATFHPGSGYAGPITVGGQRFSKGAGGNLVVQASTNNRAPSASNKAGTSPVPSPAFALVDQLIFNLDATYELLTGQAAWVNYATTIAGDWDLCANCNPGASGKKLFRQYNFNRVLVGAPTVTTPIDPTASAGTLAGYVEIILDTSSGNYIVTNFEFTPAEVVWVTASLNQGMANPLAPVDPSQYGLPQGSGQLYDFALAMANATGVFPPPGQGRTALIECCTFDSNGAPGLKQTVELHVLTV